MTGADHVHAEPSVVRFKFLSVADLKQRPAIPWRVLRVIPSRGLVVLWGASGSGKSFLLLDMLAAVARNVHWHGRRVRGGLCVLIATEGSLAARIAAYQKAHAVGDDELEGLRVLESSINLLDAKADLPELIAALARLEDELGPIAIVAIDTLNRAMPGGNENNPQDMGAMVAAAGRIEERFRCVVLYAHHSGKDESLGARGHSSLKAAVDAELSVKRHGHSFDAIRELTASKVRDAEDGEVLLTFKLEKVDLGALSKIDPDADPDERLDSCCVKQVDAVSRRGRKDRREPGGANQRQLLNALRQGIADGGVPVPDAPERFGLTVEKLRAVASSGAFLNVAAKHRASRINDALKGLRSSGYVQEKEGLLWLADQ